MPIGVLPDYPLWSWTASNGEATDAQTWAALNAVRNQGFVHEFSRLVWNDIVDLLGEALLAAGLTWDETYTTAAEAKIPESGDGALTATMFNSVTHNLDRIKPGWLWVWDRTKDPGFTGRLEFYSDEKVYGWYFEELILVLNIFIALLRGDEDYIHLLRIHKNIPAPRRSVLLPAPGKLPVGHHFAPMPVDSRMKDLPVKAACGSGLIDVPAQGLAEAKALAALRDERLISVKDKPVLHRFGLERLQAQSVVPVLSRGNLEARIYRFFFVRYLARAAAQGRLETKSPVAATGRLLIPAFSQGRVNPLGALPVGKGEYLAPTVYRGNAAIHAPEQPYGEYLSGVVYQAQADSHAVNWAAGRYLAEAPKRGKADISPGLSVGGSYLASAPAQALSEAKATQTARGEATVPIAYSGAADTKSVEPVGGTSVIGYTALSNPKWGYPLDLFGRNLVSAVSKAAAESKLPRTAGYGGIIRSVGQAVTEAVQIIRLSARSLVGRISRAGLGLIGTEADWFDPVQTGSNLYIRSAWLFWHDRNKGYFDTDIWYETIQDGTDLYIRSVNSSWQDDEKLYLDLQVFYEPKREGNDLYIRSMDAMWQDGDKAYADLTVFYEPKQVGADLYIRSADSVWTDGSAGNIDTAFFLEPVQEGSDLYIRQSIFGGD